MGNFSVSYALEKGPGKLMSKSAMAKRMGALERDNNAMRQELAQVKQQLAAITLVNQKAPFPDVPQDHWANDAVETLHGNNVMQGYPDGQFKGDRPMTRYEYAQMLFRALSKGMNVNQAHVRQYAPELQQIAQQSGDPRMQQYVATVVPQEDLYIRTGK